MRNQDDHRKSAVYPHSLVADRARAQHDMPPVRAARQRVEQKDTRFHSVAGRVDIAAERTSLIRWECERITLSVVAPLADKAR